ncbi:hypothetical protein JZ751_019226 [Albula glossodonta]|uniref:Protein kinase domain-containing protein n=1 Tax=Albula glossodonta TaxID=121402 RepID=A0A8T2NYE5_9TELE|nr:hypothetical protein JZ751_019226 [Albula glossodonta]
MGNEQSVLQRNGYKLLEEAGRRDFGNRACRRCTKDGKEYIIQEINLADMDDIRKIEVQTRTVTLNSMNHPNIVKYKETFEERGLLYVVIEFCEGGDLSQLIAKKGRTLFSEDKILDWFVQICMAMKYIHSQNILHKDISSQFKMTVDELQVKVDELKEITAHMESVHFGTTAGSLAGGVIGAAGGITSIVGLILAPFTLGASLIVTGVGIGVAVAGGVTGAASNITNMVKQSAGRNSIQAILNECQEKIHLSVTCLQNISDGINTVNAARSIDSEGLPPIEGRTNQALVRAGRGLAGVGELVRLIQVVNIGKVAAQVARTVRVAEAATGVLAGLFVALDIYFIAQDSREIHAMRQESTNSTDNSDDNKSDTRKFIDKMKQASIDLQNCVDELRVSIPEPLQAVQ